MQTIAERYDTASGTRAKFEPVAVTLQDQDRWAGLRLEQWVGQGGEMPETVLFQHGLLINFETLWSSHVHWSGMRPRRGDLAPGTFSLFPAHHAYHGDGKGSWRGMAIAIAPELVQSVFTQPGGGSVELKPGFGLSDPFLLQTCMALAQDVREGYPCGAIYGETLAVALAAHLRRNYAADPRGDSDDPDAADPRRQRVRQYILDQLHERLTLAELAAFSQLELYPFARWFKRAFGMAPHQYILAARVDKARSLLRGTRTSLVDVALQCGFNSQSHFASTFRRVVGVAPGVYRSMARKWSEPG